MKRKIILISLTLLMALTISLSAASPIIGLWKNVDDKSGELRALINIYSSNGKIYGKIIASYENGVITETMNSPVHKSMNLPGTPFINGLDIIYDMTDGGNKWKGSICDPEPGKFYDCDIWWDTKKNVLVVQGKLRRTILGRKQFWLKASNADIPAGFVMPNMVPNVPLEK